MAAGNAKSVYQYDLQGKFIARHRSQKDAAKALGRESSKGAAISAHLAGKYKSAYGFQWSRTFVTSMRAIVHERTPKGNDPRMVTMDKLATNLRRELPVKDHGIITKPGHREYGRHKIELGTMEIYFKPGKSVEEIVEKYSRVILG